MLVDDGGTCVLIACLEVAGRGATYHQHHHIGSFGDAHGFVDVGIVLVAYGTAFGVGHLCPALVADTFKHSHDALGVLRCSVVT